MENNEKVLDDLARQFAVDYFSISDIKFGPSNVDIIKKEIFAPKHQESINLSPACNVRNIFVIGAGASFDCYNDLPLADTAIAIIKQKPVIMELENNAVISRKMKEYKDRLEIVYRLNPHDFESQMALYSNFITAEDLHEQLYELYGKRWRPSSFYEILAHLFKHRFIDVIINFNFDELLDQALEEELGPADYRHIYSEGQCKPFNKILSDGRLKLPVYIKPHGTISHKSSLKFTKEAYFGLSIDMIKLLEKILGGERGDGVPRIERVNLIVVGSSLKSFEFNKIIKEKLPEQGTISFFSVSPPDVQGFAKEDPLFAEKFIRHHAFPDGSPRFFQIDKNAGKNALGRAFEDLYNRKLRKNLFNPVYEPKDINRHIIITEVFYKDGERRFQKNSTYLLVRTYLEFVIALCKSKGRITIEELMHERFGYYYKEYYDRIASKKKKVETIFDIFDFFELDNNCVNKTGKKIHYRYRDGERLVPQLLQKFISLGHRSDCEELKGFSRDENKVEIVEKALKKIHEHDSLSISPKFSFLKFYTFRGATENNIIPTKLALIRRFISSIGKWDLMLMSSNKGKMLFNLLKAEADLKSDETPQYDYSKKVCCLILEDDLYQKDLERLIGKKRLIDGNIHISNKDNDGDNIMLFLQRNHGNMLQPWQLIKGIHYHRIGNSLKIFPYSTKNQEHLKLMKEEFFDTYFTSLIATPNAFETASDDNKVLKILQKFAQDFDKL